MSAAPGAPTPPQLGAETWNEYDSLALEFRILAAAAHDGIRAEPTLGIDNMRRQLVAIEAEANAQWAKYAELSYYAAFPGVSRGAPTPAMIDAAQRAFASHWPHELSPEVWPSLEHALRAALTAQDSGTSA